MSLPVTNLEYPLDAKLVSELRHELRTPINHIVGYCEMLLEDAADDGLQERQVQLATALDAARVILRLISSALPVNASKVEKANLVQLYESLREPQGEILGIADALLGDSTGPLKEGEARDLQKVRTSATLLLAALESVLRPETEAPAPVGDHPQAGAEAESTGLERSGAALILVVDDNEDNRSILQRRLERQGYDVECAENGNQALERVESGSFDLVLLDIMMPDIDGYEVLERLKSSPSTRDIPIIMISALDDMASIVRCVERGAEDYLPKPFDPILLRARISASLEKKRMRDAEIEYLRQVSCVIDAATAVEAGTFESGSLSAITRRSDELGRLARVFDAMASQVRAREDRLHKQVNALQRVIADASRRQRQPETRRYAELPLEETFAERYDILEVIDSGGMGMVYRAKDRELDEIIAIKTLHSDLLTGDGNSIERFKSEIRLARRISDSSVVRIHDFGESGGVYYLTMEYVEGVTARELIDAQGKLGVPSTLAITSQLAKSLAVAHAQGVIHRDIKPNNLLLDKKGTLKVLDFGVAMLAERGAQLTEAGMVVGTPTYMAPEQLLEEETDERSDLYSTGVVMYECLTGRLPFEGHSAVTIIAKLLSDDAVPPIELEADIPPTLSALVMKLLSKEPSQRPQSADELSDLLQQFV